MTEYYENLGAKLRHARRTTGMTIYDVADKLGVCASTIARWEKGERRIPLDQLGLYAQAIGYDTFQLTTEA